jgi:hypothetical protein
MLYHRSNCVVSPNRPGFYRSETQEKEKTQLRSITLLAVILLLREVPLGLPLRPSQGKKFQRLLRHFLFPQ